MATKNVISLIRFEDGSESIILVKAKAAEYFGIEEIVPNAVTVRRRAYSYYRSDGATNEPGKEISVPSSRYSRVPRLSTKSVRAVRVPKEIVSPRGNVRTHVIRFPVKADYDDISHWLYWNCKLHKPNYFLTEAGKKRLVWDRGDGDGLEE